MSVTTLEALRHDGPFAPISLDTLPFLRRTLEEAGLEEVVVAVVGPSAVVARHWRAPLSLLFVDGGTGQARRGTTTRDGCPTWRPAGFCAARRVFADPAEGGRPPYELWCRARASGAFVDVSACGSLRVLRRVAPGL